MHTQIRNTSRRVGQAVSDQVERALLIVASNPDLQQGEDAVLNRLVMCCVAVMRALDDTLRPEDMDPEEFQDAIRGTMQAVCEHTIEWGPSAYLTGGQG